MPSSTVTSKGQITIPIEVRRALKLKSGSRIDFVPLANGSYELAPATGSIKDLKGFIKPPSKPITLEEMDQGIAAAIAERVLR